MEENIYLHKYSHSCYETHEKNTPYSLLRKLSIFFYKGTVVMEHSTFSLLIEKIMIHIMGLDEINNFQLNRKRPVHRTVLWWRRK